jgi:hypothetical protein
MNPTDLLQVATKLVDTTAGETSGLWSRAAAMLARQALEGALREFLRDEAPGAHEAPFKTQLLLLRALHQDKELAARTAYAWGALTRATHHQGYELGATAEELRAWIETVRTFVDAERSD